jgi:hypothetical protein
MRARCDGASAAETIETEEETSMGARRNERRAQQKRNRRDALRALACGVLGAALLGATGAQAAEPFRLLLVREAGVTEGECIRGTLFVVQSFSEADTARGVRLADSVEVPRSAAAAARFASSGPYLGSAREDGPLGWRIEIDGADASRPLRAKPASDLAEVAGSVFVGRRPPGTAATACDPSVEPLEDGAVLMRRLRQIYGSPANDRPIEIRIQP